MWMTNPSVCLGCRKVVDLGHTDGMVRAVKSFADVRRQVEAELTLIIPSIGVTSCGRAWACVGHWEVKLYGEGHKIYGTKVRKSITIAETAGRKYGRCTVTQQKTCSAD